MSSLNFRARRAGSREIQFQCPLACSPCRYRFPDGRRCKRKVCQGLPYCWSHTQTVLHLRYQKSSIEGIKGLYVWDKAAGAAPVFKKGQRIVHYVGERVSAAELDRRYDYDGHNNTAPYAIKKLDAACLRGVASLINSPYGSGKRSNVLFKDEGEGVVVVAKKNLYHGDELFVHYGSDYWRGVKNLDVNAAARVKNRGRIYAAQK